MNRMNDLQLFALLLLSGVWAVICTPTFVGTGEMAGALFACVAELLLCAPLLRRNAPDFKETVLRFRWLGYVYAVYFLLWGAMAFSQLYAAAPRGLFSMPDTVTAALLIIVTCLYTSTAGLKATARTAPLLLLLIIVSTLVLIVGAWKRIVPDRLHMQTEGMGSGVLTYLAASGELTAVWVLMGRTKGDGRKAVRAYLPAKLGMFILLFCLSITTGGRLTGLQKYPFLTLTALCQPLDGQRVDALYLLEFVMLFVLHITLLTGMTTHILTLLHPKLERTAPLALPVMLLLAWLVPSQTLQIASIAAMPLLVCGVPLVTMIRRRSERRAAA